MALPTFVPGRVKASDLQLLSSALTDIQNWTGNVYYSALSTDLSLTTSESAVVLSGSFTFQALRAYQVLVGHRWTTSGTTNTVRVRFYSGGATLLDLGGVGASQGGNTFGATLSAIVINSTSSDMVRTVGATNQMSASTGTWNGGATYPRFLWIRDVGASSLYSGATAVV